MRVEAAELFAQVIVGLAIALVVEGRVTGTEAIKWVRKSGYTIENRVEEVDDELPTSQAIAVGWSAVMMLYASLAAISLTLCLGSTAKDKPLSTLATWFVLGAVAYQILAVIILPAIVLLFSVLDAAGHPLNRHTSFLTVGAAYFAGCGVIIGTIFVFAAL